MILDVRIWGNDSSQVQRRLQLVGKDSKHKGDIVKKKSGNINPVCGKCGLCSADNATA